jgi:hypothetical protein
MPEPYAQLSQSEEPEKPNPLAEMQDKYRHTPLVSTRSNLRFVGRIVIEVFEGSAVFPDGVDIALTWVLPPDRDAGLIFQQVAARLSRIGRQIGGSRPAGAVTASP